MGGNLSVVCPTTHNALVASEVDPLSNWGRPCMENEGGGGGRRIHHTCSYGMFGGYFKGIEEIIRRRG